ncbi:uncharacterized protein EI97DRAFT_233610 [Westerdykella ornata]|uniref:Uncharacterized protein n=1 Tax=Westerdykella ornata TaxID=318751 RepID=A0A6A6J701_WESOR|nr:uncharacterized protein EI97DRAFT_233610 [Westerdykella ornata]KAF2272192.1 hypothetical protein EI97DRAFT_233610 [Westerdykella ornata]
MTREVHFFNRHRHFKSILAYKHAIVSWPHWLVQTKNNMKGVQKSRNIFIVSCCYSTPLHSMSMFIGVLIVVVS